MSSHSQNVELATEAICRYLKGSHSGDSRQTLIIGHDTRFMGEKFVAVAAEIARKKGFRVLQCESRRSDTGPVARDTLTNGRGWD